MVQDICYEVSQEVEEEEIDKRDFKAELESRLTDDLKSRINVFLNS